MKGTLEELKLANENGIIQLTLVDKMPVRRDRFRRSRSYRLRKDTEYFIDFDI